MKKVFIYFCLSFTMGLLAQEDIVYILDTNLKGWLVTRDFINTNGDDEIQVSEAIAFTGNVAGYPGSSGNPITDATGLEAFINITSINFSGQALTTLDLSSNPLIEVAILAYNNLSSINLSNNLALKNISLHSNSLIELDVSNSPMLEFLNVAQNPNLTQVNLANGNNYSLESVVLSPNPPNLTCVQIDPGFVVPYPPGGYGSPRWYYNDYSVFSEDCWQDDLSVEDLVADSKKLSIYPNPVKNILNIHGLEIKSLQVYNMLGQQMKVSYTNNVVNVENIPSGNYILQVENEEGKLESTKFIKQ